eukprot:TRINITY_DN18742_c0_g3_i2.p1 TRINITY_DN18742_c0_g3~~TRINITY_DN18742_c0_g3_i2.p1  ORF type:complete len:724 (-),score=140.42 TRINITY_DN18742_c0_g3_i2:140-2311(-)
MCIRDSTDGGVSWSRLSPQGVEELAQSPLDPMLLFLLSGHTRHWITSDGGASFQQIHTPSRIGGVKWHPFERAWALAFATDPSCATKAGFTCMGHLMLTQDSGESWRKIADGVKPLGFEWQQHHDRNSVNLDRTESSKRRIVLIRTSGEKRIPSGLWDTGYDLVGSGDWFQTSQVLLQGGNLFVSSGRMMFVVKAESQAHVTLWVSSDGGGSWHSTTSSSNTMRIQKPHSFGVLHDPHESAILIAVKTSSGADTSRLWISGTAGRRWVPSITDVHYGSEGVADLEMVDGLAGVYLVNQLLGAKAWGRKGPKLLKTRISFDRGAQWTHLSPPRSGVDGRSFGCTSSDQCSLSLFFANNPLQYPPPYSLASAVGLVVAVGAVSKHLSMDIKPAQVSTFFSRDAGHSWVELQRGSWQCAFGDHGALLVAVPHIAPYHNSRNILVSTDEGTTWTKHPLGSMYVSGIFTVGHLSAISRQFLLFAQRSLQDDTGVVISLDLRHTLDRKCHGAHDPGSSQSDYEKWNPRDSLTASQHSGCLLGRRMFYVRRKKTSKCFNGANHQAMSEQQNCACTRMDFECDFGFEPAGTTPGECSLSPQASNQVQDLAALYHDPSLQGDMCARWGEQNGYMLSAPSGYRGIPGDVCHHGVRLGPKVFPCRGALLTLSNLFWAVVLGGMVGIVYWGVQRWREQSKSRGSGAWLDRGAGRDEWESVSLFEAFEEPEFTEAY